MAEDWVRSKNLATHVSFSNPNHVFHIGPTIVDEPGNLLSRGVSQTRKANGSRLALLQAPKEPTSKHFDERLFLN
jgi:hypothetical protein